MFPWRRRGAKMSVRYARWAVVGRRRTSMFVGLRRVMTRMMLMSLHGLRGGSSVPLRKHRRGVKTAWQDRSPGRAIVARRGKARWTSAPPVIWPDNGAPPAGVPLPDVTRPYMSFTRATSSHDRLALAVLGTCPTDNAGRAIRGRRRASAFNSRRHVNDRICRQTKPKIRLATGTFVASR